MSAIINTNIDSLNSQRQLTRSQGDLSTALQRLSSGLRINSAKDDAAGLAIADRFTSQIRGLDQARRNANDGISLAQTAEGSLSSMADMLQRVRELAVQSANETNSASDRAALQNEVANLTAELNRMAQTTQFNGRNLLDGTFTSAQFQVGANANQTITATSQNFLTSAYGSYRMGSLEEGDDTTHTTNGDLVKGSTTTNVITTYSATNASRLTGTTFTVNGSLGSQTITYAATDTAKIVAGAVNAKSALTGVTATARTEIQMLSFTAAKSYSVAVTADNTTAVTVAFTVGAAVNSDGLSAAVAAFNDVSSKTGVTARVDDGGTSIILTNAAGNNVTLANAASGSTSFNLASYTGGGNATASAAIATGATALIQGQLTLDSDKTFNVSGATANDWFTATTGASQQQAVQYADVSNKDAANRTIALIDGALQNVATQRARYGALQNRFESTVKSLMTASENMSASRSRIQDADFASETANLTRAQILQQAGIAMLSQANALPQQVLSLLK